MTLARWPRPGFAPGLVLGLVIFAGACSLEGFSAEFGREVDGGATEDAHTADVSNACPVACGDRACNDGVCEPAIFAISPDPILEIAATATEVTWSTPERIRTCPPSSCPSPREVIAPRALTGSFSRTGRDIVVATGVTSSNGAIRCEFARCATDVTILFDLAGARSLVADGLDVFILEAGAGRVRHCGAAPGCGNSPALVATAPATGPVVLGAQRVYWTALPPVNAVYGALRSGGDRTGTLTPLARDQKNPTSIAIDGANVYWTTFDDGAVRACAQAGCPGGPTDLATGQAGPAGVASDGTFVYWANAGAGTVVRCSVTGCGSAGPVTLARGLDNPRSLALGGSNLWVVTGRTTIVRVPR